MMYGADLHIPPGSFPHKNCFNCGPYSLPSRSCYWSPSFTQKQRPSTNSASLSNRNRNVILNKQRRSARHFGYLFLDIELKSSSRELAISTNVSTESLSLGPAVCDFISSRNCAVYEQDSEDSWFDVPLDKGDGLDLGPLP